MDGWIGKWVERRNWSSEDLNGLPVMTQQEMMAYLEPGHLSSDSSPYAGHHLTQVQGQRKPTGIFRAWGGPLKPY